MEKLEWTQLPWWLKTSVIVTWIWLVLFVIGFISGYLSVI